MRGSHQIQNLPIRGISRYGPTGDRRSWGSSEAHFSHQPGEGAGITPNETTARQNSMDPWPDTQSGISHPGRYGMMMRRPLETGVFSVRLAKVLNHVMRDEMMLTSFAQSRFCQHYLLRSLR
jgi:hypothetical protein